MVRNRKESQLLKSHRLDTPLGPILAVADEEVLYLLEFVAWKNLERAIERLKVQMKSAIIPGITLPIRLIEEELRRYFDGTLKEFKTPLFTIGSPFQKLVWTELQKIPYGTTASYAAIAQQIGKETAYRAVANANGANAFAIVIPCHRVINASGELGGYGGGIARKKWLINHEIRSLQTSA